MIDEDKDKIWHWLMNFFSETCHQRADRSLFYKKYQLPICSRCTGLVVGYIAGIIKIFIKLISLKVSIILMMIMFLDWLIQYKEIRESTNLRRLITGFLGGIGIINLIGNIIVKINIFI